MADLAAAERLLRHPVAVVSTHAPGLMIAASVAGDPPCTRLAWIDWRASAIAIRLVCPPGCPTALRPVVATDVRVAQAGIAERVVVARAAPGIAAIALVVADERQPEPVPVGDDGVALFPVDDRLTVLGVDALMASGEPAGRLDAAGIGLLGLSGGRITGRMGASHGLAAGFGAGHWVGDLDAAAFEAGFVPRLPGWIPDGLAQGRFHIEPDVAYPAAPPAVAVAWGTEPRRVLVRQMAGVPAAPDPGGARTEPVEVDGVPAVRMVRGRFATLVWQGADRAYGVQVSGLEDPGAVAVRIAASV